MKVTAGFLVLTVSCIWGLPQSKEDVIPADQLIPQPRNTAGRIVGGWDAVIEDFPYQVAVLIWDIPSCGGFIISESWVVSAAHCMVGLSLLSWYSVRAGSSLSNSGGVVVSITMYYDHPLYTNAIRGYDITLLHLSSVLPLGPGISVITLPSEDEDVPAGERVVVSGWGRTEEYGSPSIQLQAVEVSIVSNEDCTTAYWGFPITDSMLCAGYLGVGLRGPCQQDSGGPLAWNGLAVGVVSWSFGCARPGYPAVYARVSHVRTWITEVSGV